MAALAAAAGQAASLGQAACSHAAPLAAEQQLPALASAASLQQLFLDEQQPVSVAQHADAAALLQAPSSDSERLAAEYRVTPTPTVVANTSAAASFNTTLVMIIP